MLFADMLFDSGFNARVQDIAIVFRKKAGIPFTVHQAGIVVADVEEAAADLEARGFGPFMMAAASLPRWTERGADDGSAARWVWRITTASSLNFWNRERVPTFTGTAWIPRAGRSSSTSVFSRMRWMNGRISLRQWGARCG